MKKMISKNVKERYVKVIEAYIKAVCEGIPETYERFLISGIPETNIFRFLSLAFWLSQKPKNERKANFRKFVELYQEDIADEVKHDGPDVMNLCGILGAIKKNKQIIMGLAEEMPQRLERGWKVLLEANVNTGDHTSEEFFKEILKEHPAAMSIRI